MMSPPERSPERDAAVAAILDVVPEHGWSMASLRQALPEMTELSVLFPGGGTDLIEAYCDLADRQMEEDAAALDVTGLGLTKRVRAVMAARLARQRPHRDAIRRALAVLALPQNGVLATRTLLRTVDAVWFAAGDQSADASWYTKRAILAAVYGATLLFWLRDYGEDDSDTLSFLDRRLAGVGRIGRAKGRVGRMMGRFKPAGHAAAA